MANLPTSFNSAIVIKEITIHAPQDRVRQVLLDFDRLPEWKNKFIYTITIHRHGTDEKVAGVDAKPGDVLSLNGPAGPADAVILENTPTIFKWQGAKFGFTAIHWYEILPSPEGEGKTVFKHCETYEGGAAFMFWSYSPLRGWVEGLFMGFCEDLQKQVEVQRT